MWKSVSMELFRMGYTELFAMLRQFMNTEADPFIDHPSLC